MNRLTWWAIVAHDRMLSLGTGRPVTIKSYEISVSNVLSPSVLGAQFKRSCRSRLQQTKTSLA